MNSITARLFISRHVLQGLLEQCRSTAIERVYLGVGLKKNSDYVVEEVFECPNVASTPEYKFVADPLCVYNVFEKANKAGREVILLVHCHPALPYPSLEDLKGMKYSPGICWLIISSLSGEYKAWLLELSSELPVEVEVTTS